MTKKPTNHGEPWTPAAVANVRALARQNTPTRVIGIKTGRTESAIYGIAQREGISLKPTNQRPNKGGRK